MLDVLPVHELLVERREERHVLEPPALLDFAELRQPVQVGRHLFRLVCELDGRAAELTPPRVEAALDTGGWEEVVEEEGARSAHEPTALRQKIQRLVRLLASCTSEKCVVSERCQGNDKVK